MPGSAALTDVVAASREQIIEALLDFDSYSRWQGGVLSCTVRERDGAGRGSLVDMYVDAKIKRIRYTVRYRYDLPDRLGWDYVSGDLAQCRATYTFTEQDARHTRVSMDIDADAGFFVPGPLKKVIRDQAVRRSMRDLKAHLE